MPSLFDWVVIISAIVVLVVAVEYYVTDYRRRRSDIEIIPTGDSTWRRTTSGWEFDHRLRLANNGPRAGRISDVRVDHLQLTNGTSRTVDDQAAVWAEGIIRQVPDGSRVPPGYTGECATKTRVSSRAIPTTLLREFKRASIQFTVEVSDPLGEYSITVVDEFDLPPGT